MRIAYPTIGADATRTLTALLGTLNAMPRARKILADNLARLMAHDVELRNQKSLRRRAKLGGGTIDGIVSMRTAPTLDSIERLAQAFGLEAYQMLIPDLDPKNPAVAKLPENQLDFMRNLERLTRELHQTVADYGPREK